MKSLPPLKKAQYWCLDCCAIVLRHHASQTRHEIRRIP